MATTETEHVGETLAVSLPNEAHDVEEQSTTTEQAEEPFHTFDEEPLNELEWLDVISAEQDMPEVQYVPDVADAPPLPDEAWSEEEPMLHEDAHEGDLAQDVPEPDVDEEETATNSSRETLLTPKTTKAVIPGRQRSKNKHKGRNTTGSFRS